MHQRPARNLQFGNWTQGVGEGGVAAVHASNSKGVVFPNDILCAQQAVRRQVAGGVVVVGQGLVVGDSRTLANRQGEAWQPIHMDLVWIQSRGGTDRIAVYKFDRREIFIPLVLELVDDYCTHLCQSVVYAVHPTVAVWMVRTGGNWFNPDKPIYDVRMVRAELEAVVREDAARAAQRGIYCLMRILAVLSAVNSTAVMAYMAAETISGK